MPMIRLGEIELLLDVSVDDFGASAEARGKQMNRFQ